MLLTLSVSALASAQSLQGADLVKALRKGGYVVVMRHASSPMEAPVAGAADAENTRGERQLDEKGRTSAAAMGEALRRLKIPVGEVLSSPTYRALQTVKYARLGEAKTYAELGDGGRSMQGGTEAQAQWLRGRVTRFSPHTNTFLVTHNPNLIGAFPQWATGVGDGEALVFGPDGKGGATLVGRIRMEEWAGF